MRMASRVLVTHDAAKLCRAAPVLGLADSRVGASRKTGRFLRKAVVPKLAARRSVSCRAKEAKALEQELAENPSEYFEAFLRSLLLGVGAGVACEALHVAIEFAAVVRKVRLDQLAQAWPQVRSQFAPVVVDDHLVAAGCWLLFYGIEAYAVMRVMEKHQQNPAAAARALRKLTTLPKLLLPRLAPFKTALKLPGVAWQWTAALAFVGVTATPGQQGRQGTGAARGVVMPQPGVPAPPISDPAQEPEGPVGPRIRPLRPPTQPGVGSPPVDRVGRAGPRPAERDFSADAVDRRRKQLADNGYALQNFWYAAALSQDLNDAPLGVDILGEKIVLFRDSSGKVACLQDYCPHKGAPLSAGSIGNKDGHDCIVCPYHGWEFDAQGRLLSLPSEEGGLRRSSIPLVASYPVVEKGGFVWLFFGSPDLPADERPPVPFVPELEDRAWRPVYGEIGFDCGHHAVFENAIDMAHIHYLHADSFGNQEMPQIRGMSCSTNAYGVDASFVLHNKPVNAMWAFSEVPEVSVTAKALLASTSVIGFRLAHGLSFITFVSTVPISATKTINRFALIRRFDSHPLLAAFFNLGIWDFLAVRAMLKILSQDKVMVEQLRPEMVLREVSANADLPQIAFRRLRQQYIDMGYGVRMTSVLEKCP